MSIKAIKQTNEANRKISDSCSALNLLTFEDSNRASLVISTAKNHTELIKIKGERIYYLKS